MMPADELCPDDFRDVKEALVVQHVVNVLPVLGQLPRPKVASVFVSVLQLLQSQSHAPDTDSIRTFGG